VYRFEHQVAELEWDRTALRNNDITYNKLTRDEVLALAPAFPTARLLDAAQYGHVQEVLLAQVAPTEQEIAELGLTPDFVAGIGGGTPAMMKLLAETPLETLKAFMAARFLSAHAAVLPSEIDQAN